MDARFKSFEPSVRDQFTFLAEAGFAGPAFDGSGTGIQQLTATFRRPGAEVQIVLTLAYAGEHTVTTTIQTTNGLTEIGSSAAHTVYQMNKRLAEHAAAVSVAVRSS